MKKERWRLYAKKADFAAISKAYGINQVTARIMRNRGVETKEEIESYLKGDLDYLSDPALMKDADKAASLLEAAIANNELIAISSDFDNDGIFSGLLLKEAIIELGGRAAIFTPKILTRSTRLPRSTIGDEIRKENVTPSGRPALVNPIKIGMDEQEQNGVTVPSRAPTIFAEIPRNLPIIFRLRSGGKKL